MTSPTLTAPDPYVTAAVDVSPWGAQKWAAVLAHRSEVARARPLPGLLARLPEGERNEIIQIEFFTRLSPGPAPGDPHRRTAGPACTPTPTNRGLA